MAPSADHIIPLLLAGTGVYLAWFGIHYWGSDTKWPSDPVKSVLQGNAIPAPGGSQTAVETAALVESSPVGSTSSSASGSTASGGTQTTAAGSSAVASDGLKYVGEGYIFGGPSSPGKWDCSSFVNYVVGHDLGMPIPGGSWAVVCANGTEHGPATPSWMLFGTPINYGSEQPGDLLVTAEHMGIVIGGGNMVSAQNPQLGTGIGNYTSGFPGGQPVVRRVG